MARAADLIIEGIGEFAKLSTTQEFVAAAGSLREEAADKQPSTLRELIEGSLLAKRIDRLTLRRFSLAARATEVAMGNSPWHHQIVCALLLSRRTIVQMPNGSGKTLAIALAAVAGALTGKRAHIVTSNDYLAERDCRWMGSLYQLLGLRVGVVLTSQSLHFKHGILEPDGITLRMAPADDDDFKPTPENSVDQVQREAPGENDTLTSEGPPPVSPAEGGASHASETDHTDDVPWPGSTQLPPESDQQLPHTPESAYVVDRGLSLKQVLSCDVVYGRIETFGFAYLRDNQAMLAEAQTLTRRDALIIDECDSVLLDDLSTPLVLTQASGPSAMPLETIGHLHEIAKALSLGTHFVLSGKSIQFTYDGVDALYEITEYDLFTPDKGAFALGVLNALKAIYAYHRDTDYIVYDGQIVLVELASGRLLFGRRYQDGLQQAIEYNEGLRIRHSEDSRPIASITIKHFARTYSLVSGTSGAIGVPEEYQQFYGLESVELEPYPLTRRDHPDLVYRTQREAIEYGVIPKAISASKKRQPVLINAPSLSEVREIAEKLIPTGVPVQVLDVNTVRTLGEEAEKVKRAGSAGLVTVCSRLAARGTDIILSEEAKGAGGLFVIGLHRAMDRRYDDQLRGRAARHGDPGDAVFVVSLEDDLMRVFARDWVTNLLQRLGMEEGVEIESNLITQRIRGAQRGILRRAHAARSSVVELDDTVDRHRTLVYKVRQKILEADDIFAELKTMLENWIYVWQQKKAKQGFGSKEGAGFEPFSYYLDRAETSRIMNVRNIKARCRVLKNIAEGKLAQALQSPYQTSDWCKAQILGKLDERWYQYLSLESAARDDLALYPLDLPAGIAKHAQTMEEHFDSFFIQVGAEVLGDILANQALVTTMEQRR